MTDSDSSVQELARRLRAGERRALARAITLVESARVEDDRRAALLMSELLPHTGGALRIGVSGAPGVGKSTFIEAFGMHLVKLGHRVAVLAIDPSSALSGGSILGDKTRMPELSASDRVFVRPSPSGGSLGGVAQRTREAALLCEAAGYDIVLIETVGVGQSEFAVAHMTDTFLLLALAGAGDELQGIKRGIFELIDLLAITKADGENVSAAERARAEYASALRLLHQGLRGTVPEVLCVSAVEQRGIETVWSQIERAVERARASGAFDAKRAAQRRAWFSECVEQELHRRFFARPGVPERFSGLQAQVFQGDLLPREAARQLLNDAI
ncbi:MAG TPA: methylmalonyl Co-A mutase-associated GTPase MeaB [Polyangiaceae bacterium]|nr:methylmalonyl Co-A mutase-associated GTPase MeaB [Polyangiaceae bacterium]